MLWKKGANITDPETAKEAIANQKWSLGTKVQAVRAYNGFLGICGLSWVPPRYKQNEKLPFIPLEKELDTLIAAASRKLAAFLQLLKETGCRGDETAQLR